MAWRRSGDKPLSEPMMVRLPTHICITWLQWINHISISDIRYYYCYVSSQFGYLESKQPCNTELTSDNTKHETDIRDMSVEHSEYKPCTRNKASRNTHGATSETANHHTAYGSWKKPIEELTHCANLRINQRNSVLRSYEMQSSSLCITHVPSS